MKNKTAKILDTLGFNEIKGLRGKKSLRKSPELVKTLSITTNGRITIPYFLLDYLDLQYTYFNVGFNDKKEAAILFHNDAQTPGAKKIVRYKHPDTGAETTAYIGIGPELRAKNYSWKVSKLRFEKKAPRLIIINLKDLAPKKKVL